VLSELMEYPLQLKIAGSLGAVCSSRVQEPSSFRRLLRPSQRDDVIDVGLVDLRIDDLPST